jgi:hypothetical protein
MRLAGIYLNDDEVLALAGRLRALGLGVAADRLTGAYYRDARQLDLRGVEPQAFIPALEDGPASFAELRGALLAEHGWRGRDGLTG